MKALDIAKTAIGYAILGSTCIMIYQGTCVVAKVVGEFTDEVITKAIIKRNTKNRIKKMKRDGWKSKEVNGTVYMYRVR